MRNKSLEKGIIVVSLITIMALLGCPTGFNSGPAPDDPPGDGGTASNAAAAAVLTQTLNTGGQANVRVDAANGTVTVLRDLVVEGTAPNSSVAAQPRAVGDPGHIGSFSIPAGVKFEVPADLSVTVEEGGKITVDSGTSTYKAAELSAQGYITVKADEGIVAAGTITVAGTLEVPANASIKVEGGTLAVASSGQTVVNGTVIVEKAVTGDKQGTVTVAENAVLEVAEGGVVNVAQGAAVSVAQGGALAVDEGATVAVAGDVSVAEGGTVSVAGTLEVAGGTVSVAGTLEVAGGVLGGSGNLTLEEGAAVEVKDGGEADLTGITTEVNGSVTVTVTGPGSAIELPPETGDTPDNALTGDQVTVEDGGQVGQGDEPGEPEPPPSVPSSSQPITIRAISGVVGPGADGTLAAATTVDTTSQFTGTVQWTPALPVSGKFEAGKLYTATITLTPRSGYTLAVGADHFTVAGAKAVNAAGSGTVTAVFPGVRADAVSGLGDAVAAAKGYSGGGVVYLSSDFYTSANTAATAIVVDPGDADNTSLYTIQGLGKDSAETLTVGIRLANDHVTLDGVKINITDSARAVATDWFSGSYKAGVSINRSSASLLTGADMANNKVTVKDCAITFTGTTGFTAGIYFAGTTVSGTTYPPKNITITGNTVSASGPSSTQALGFRQYHPSITITGNSLTSTNNVSGGWDTPAGALFIQLNPVFFTDELTPQISGNTLNGIHDFYINIFSTGNYVGIPNLFANKFGTVNTTWAASTTTDTGDSKTFYKKLFDSLLPQAKGGNGYGLIQMVLGGAAGSFQQNEAALEQYDINGGVVTAIDYWGPETMSGVAYTNASTKKRDRITVSSGVPDTGSIATNTFHWTKATVGTDL